LAGFHKGRIIPPFYLPKTTENLDSLPALRVLLCDNSPKARQRGTVMFKDMFNFKKQRTLKESVGFFLFYAMLIMGFQGFAMMMGL